MITQGANTQQRVIVLAGAGASVHIGLPTLDDLLQRAVLGNDETADLIRESRNSIEADASRYKKAVFEELIVRIREYLRITHALRTDPTLRRVVGNIPHEVDNGTSEVKWKKALTRCFRVLLDEYGPIKVDHTRSEFQVTLDLLARLAEVNKGNLHIFTTNYDCSYQVLAAKCETMRFATHINNLNGKFREQWNCVLPELTSRSLPTVYVHRLHGCVAWFTACNGNDDLGMNCASIEEAYGAGENLTIDDDDYLNNMCIKLIAAQLVGTNPVFSTAFEEFSEHLKTCDTLLAWGYSFRDLEVMRQINHVVATRQKPLRIRYIDPFLPQEKAIQNIRSTFHAVPTPLSRELIPERIEWRIGDGFKGLVETISKELNKEV